MNKNKRFVQRFINHLFGVYRVPTIPIYICYGDKEFNIGSKKHISGFYNRMPSNKCIFVAGKIGTTKIMAVIAHEFVHYVQDLHGRDMENDDVEQDANYWGVGLLDQWIINKTKRGVHTFGIYPIWEHAPKDSVPK